MSKRFTETEKWKDPWFRKLKGGIKIAYLYLLDNADNAGVWDPDFEMANFQIGMEIEWTEKVLPALEGRVEILPNGKWHVTRFVRFQYGELNEECKPHQQVFRLLKSHDIKRVSKGYPKGIHTPKDKDKDKETDKDQAKDEAVTPEMIYAAYPRKEARADAIKAIQKALQANTPAKLMMAVMAYATATKEWSASDRQFIPHPASWFNAGRYDDDQTTWKRINPAQNALDNRPNTRIYEAHDDYSGYVDPGQRVATTP